MFVSESQVRVRYGETDQMQYVYYGNYPLYYEVGRVETLRKLGFPYKKLEDEGIMLPVIDLQVKYIKPAYYDELLTIKTIIKEKPSVRITFDYEIYNEKSELINKGMTVLVAINKTTNRPTKLPEKLIEAIF